MIHIPELDLDAALRRKLRHLLDRNGRLTPEGWVVRVLTYPDGTREVFEGKNLVTDAGDLWYAQKVAGETPDNAFTSLVLGNPGSAMTPGKASTYTNFTSPIGGSTRAVEATYPKRNDSDGPNTGKAVDSITWKFVSAAADFNVSSGIVQGCITIASPTTGSPLLCAFTFTGIGKDSLTSLTTYVNHNFLGS